MAKHGNDMIWAVSMNAKRPRKKPIRVPRKLMNTAAWKNHAMKEVPDPSIKVQPITPLSAPDPAMLSELEKLRKENDELQAKLDGQQEGKMPVEVRETGGKMPVEIVPERTPLETLHMKRGPGRPPKAKPQA